MFVVAKLKVARALVALGRKLERLGDQIATRAVVQGQRQQREAYDYDEQETPDQRHPTRCPSCGYLVAIDGHAPNCDKM